MPALLFVVLLLLALLLPPPTTAIATGCKNDADATSLLTLLLGGPATTATTLTAVYGTPSAPARVADSARLGRAAWARTRRTWVAGDNIDAFLVPNRSATPAGGPLRLGADVSFSRPLDAGAGAGCELSSVARLGPAVAADAKVVPLVAARELVATGYTMTVRAAHLRDAAVHRAAAGCLRRVFGVPVGADVTLQPPRVVKLHPGCNAVWEAPVVDSLRLVVQLDGERVVWLHPPAGGAVAAPSAAPGRGDDCRNDYRYSLTEGDLLAIPPGWAATSSTPARKVSLSLTFHVAAPTASLGRLLNALLHNVSTAPLGGTATSASLATAAVGVAGALSTPLLGAPVMPTATLRWLATGRGPGSIGGDVGHVQRALLEAEEHDNLGDAVVRDSWGDTYPDAHVSWLVRAVDTFCNAAVAELFGPLLDELAEGGAATARVDIGPGGAVGLDGGGELGGAAAVTAAAPPPLLGSDAALEEADLRAWAVGVRAAGAEAAARRLFAAVLQEVVDADVEAALSAMASADRDAAVAAAQWEQSVLGAHVHPEEEEENEL